MGAKYKKTISVVESMVTEKASVSGLSLSVEVRLLRASKKTLKGDGPNRPYKYPKAKKFYFDLQDSHL